MIRKIAASILAVLCLTVFIAKAADARVQNGYLSVKIGKVFNPGVEVKVEGNGPLVIKDMTTGQAIHSFDANSVVVTSSSEGINVGGYKWVEEKREEFIAGGAPIGTAPQITEVVAPSNGQQSIIEKLNPETTATNQAVVTGDYVIKGISQRYILEPAVENAQITVNGKKYHGGLYFINSSGNLTVVNRVAIEDYLKGVVPKEIGPSSPHEALKAQAIASRSFALSNIDKYKSKGYQLDDTPYSQVYFGIGGEAETSNKAIAETAGIVGYYNGKVASLIFGASTGGVSESAKQVWGGDIPYLISVDDPYSLNVEYANWEVKMPLSELSAKLAGTKYNVGSVQAIEIVETTPQHTVKKMNIIGADGTKEISGDAFRSYIGDFKVMSTWFTVVIEGDQVVVNGHGFGHRVGMSQHGAIAMAKQGLGARDILSHYYPSVKVD
ncbi:MAG: SpoIID/LytB domain-containing protein [Tissierellia bacterium]|nr:SpoIID/LytB domain-containing protein [Tissierellia bacterium]